MCVPKVGVNDMHIQLVCRKKQIERSDIETFNPAQCNMLFDCICVLFYGTGQ